MNTLPEPEIATYTIEELSATLSFCAVICDA